MAPVAPGHRHQRSRPETQRRHHVRSRAAVAVDRYHDSNSRHAGGRRRTRHPPHLQRRAGGPATARRLAIEHAHENSAWNALNVVGQLWGPSASGVWGGNSPPPPRLRHPCRVERPPLAPLSDTQAPGRVGRAQPRSGGPGDRVGRCLASRLAAGQRRLGRPTAAQGVLRQWRADAGRGRARRAPSIALARGQCTPQPTLLLSPRARHVHSQNPPSP